MKSTVVCVMKKFSSLPPKCPKATKKPIDQARKLDTIGFF